MTLDGADDNSSLSNIDRRFAWLRRKLKEYQKNYENIFPDTWALEPMLANEFCKTTKLHIDQILSEEAHDIDISTMINALQKTQKFERQLVERFKPGGNKHQTVFEDKDGNIEIEARSAKEIREDYKRDK